MTQALTGSIAVRIATILTNSDSVSVPNDPKDLAWSWSIANGTGAGQADLEYRATRTLGASSSEELDIVGSLSSVFGVTFSPSRIKGIGVLAASGNTNNVIVGAAAATVFLAGFGASTYTWIIQPGDFLIATARGATAWPSATGSTDKLKFANSGAGTPVTYTVVLIGASA